VWGFRAYIYPATTGVKTEYNIDEARTYFGSNIIDPILNKIPPDHEPITFYQIKKNPLDHCNEWLRAVCASPIFSDPERWYWYGRTASDWQRSDKRLIHKHVRPGKDPLEEADL
jgi:hypothetical protein